MSSFYVKTYIIEEFNLSNKLSSIISPSNYPIIMIYSVDNSAAKLGISDATKLANASTSNATDAVAVAITVTTDGGLTPRISKVEYGKKMHSLMTKQPTKVGKSVVGEELVSHRQSLYEGMKARNPSIYTRDGPSQLLMTI